MYRWWQDGGYDEIKHRLTYWQDMQVQFWIFFSHPRGLYFYIQAGIYTYQADAVYTATKALEIEDVRKEIRQYGAYLSNNS